MKLVKIPKRPKSLRAIDQGTRYDISGNLRRLARAIDNGDYGDVHHVVCGVCARSDDHRDERRVYTTLGWGPAGIVDQAYTIEMMKRRVVGE